MLKEVIGRDRAVHDVSSGSFAVIDERLRLKGQCKTRREKERQRNDKEKEAKKGDRKILTGACTETCSCTEIVMTPSLHFILIHLLGIYTFWTLNEAARGDRIQQKQQKK
jgi:hypothetical protein